MAGRRADVQVRWILDLVDKASRPMLASEAKIRNSLGQTDAAHKRLGRTAVQSSQAVQRAALSQERATLRVEDAERKAEQATKRHGAASMQARRATLALKDANLGLARASAGVDAAQNRARDASRRTTAAYAAQARAADAAKRAGRGIGSGAQTASSGASRLAGTATAAGAGIGAAAAVKAFVGFEAQMDRVQAVAGATGKQMVAMGGQAKQLGADTAFSAKEAADGMYQLSTAGFTANQTMKIIPGTLALASASGIDLASAAELQASTLRGFGLEAGAAGKVADALATTVNRSAVEMSDLGDTMKYVAPVAKATGQSMDDMLAAMGLMGNVGIKGSQAGTTLRTALVRLTAPTMKAQGALEQLQIKSSDLYGPKGLRPLPDILGKIVKGSQGMDKSTRNAALSALFGREALSGMISMVEAGPKAYGRNVKALESSEGAAKRAAKTMRGNVAGAWDQFTGSLETASITMVERFGPAMKRGLEAAAGGVNTLAKRGSELVKGLATGDAGDRRTVQRGPGGRVESVDTREASTAQKIGAGIRNVAVSIGKAAAGAGRQLLDAFKPAMPFLRNVLLPLLKGIGKGILGSVVGAFKVLIPIIRVVSTALGWIGKVAAPLKPVFEGIGTVLGFLFGGPILKGIGLLGKLGGLFKIVGAAAKVLGVPVRILGSLLGGVFRVVGSLASKLAGPARAAFGAIGKAAGAVAGTIRGVAGRIGGAARGIVGTIGRALATVGKVITAPFRAALGAAISVVRGFGGKFLSAGKFVLGKLAGAFKGAGSFLSHALGGAVGFVGNIGRGIADWINSHTPMGDRVEISILGKHVGFKLPTLREGGRVPILAAGGEMLVEGGRASMIPGDPNRDGTLVLAKPGAAVLTGSGQALMAAGASLSDAIAGQAPHFATGGIVRDAFAQGYSSGKGDGGSIRGALREALVGEPHRRKSKAKASSSGTAPSNAPHVVAAMLDRARSIASRGLPYVYGGGHGGFSTRLGGYDCSGYVSNVLGPSVLSSPMAVRHPLQDALVPNAGKYVTVGIRGTSGQNAHTMVRIGSNYYESGGGHGPAKVGGWNGSFDLYHPRGLRRGGVVGRFAKGGRVPTAGGLRTAAGKGTNRTSDLAYVRVLDRLGDSLDHAAVAKIENLRRSIIRSAGAKGTSKEVAKRLRAAVSMVEFELGQRVGRITATITSRTGRLDAGATGLDRFTRRKGIDASSSAGIGLSLFRGAVTEIPGRRRNVTDARRALAAAKRGGADRDTLRELREQVTAAKDALSEAITNRAEQIRAYLTAQAQERVDTAQFGADVANAGLAGLDIRQRANGTADTAAGMRERASAISTNLVPAISAQVDAYAAQAQTAASIGDTAGARTAYLAWLGATNDMASAMADAGDLMRQAAAKTAQDLVDAATHRSTLASTGLQHLELEQRLAGTFDQGGQARADYIKGTVVPALEAEIAALQAQQQAASEAGDQALADQIAEGIAGKQNDVLQAQLDALEQVAENTEPRRFGGTLGFGFGGDTLTDLLVLQGNGA